MTAGNQAQTGLSEMALGLIEDEQRLRRSACTSKASIPVAGFERLAAARSGTEEA